MTSYGGFILVNEKRIIIPAKARAKVLQDLIFAYQGLVKIKGVPETQLIGQKMMKTLGK